MPYSSYDHDKLEAAETMRIERRIYFEAKDREIAPYASLPIAQLLSMRSESAAAEQAIFDDLKERAAAWEEQAGRTLLLDKTLEYVRTPHVQHTANEWQTTEHNRHIRSNRVYQMNYYIYENTRYDKEAQKSIPYSWTLTWSVRTNSPSRTQAKIAGQDRKVFTDKAAMEKYLNGRIKAYDRLFTEISPPIPQEYADYFKVNGMLMPDYTIEGEEPPQQQQAAAIPENTGQEKEREHMSEQFSIMIGNRSRFDAGDPGGYWLDMPATKEQLHEAMRNVGITADNPQDFSIRGYSDDPEKHIALPYEMVCAADVDELNFLAARLEQLDPAEVGKLNAALQQKNGLANIGQVIDFTYNVDFYVHIPEVHNYHDLGDYYLNQSGMVQMPEEWKGGIDLSTFGRNAAAQEKGAFTEYGYIVESGDEWERQFEGREVPEEYRIMSYPQPERGEQDKAYMDAAETQQADAQAAEPQQPVERQPGEIDAPSVRRVVHAALVGFDLPVHQLRADGLRVAEQVLAHNHDAQPGRTDVLLCPGVNHPVAVHIHRFGENHGACVGNKGRFDIRQFHKPRAVDGVVLGDVNVIRVGIELRRRHVGNVGVVVFAAGRGDIDFAVALCFFCGKVREIA